MKNLIKLCVILLTTSMFFTSCGSSLSITKRQHSKGYFVSYNKKYSPEPNKENSVEKDVNHQVAEAKKPNEFNPNHHTETNTGNISENNDLKQEHVSDATQTITTSNKKIEQTNTKQPRTIKEAKKNITSMISSAENENDSEGYSLLWIVIIVLLVLWALGLMNGLGSTGLIHALLVIALILLILWLLRVI